MNKINTRLNNKSSKSTSKSVQIQIGDKNKKLEYCNRKMDENEITSKFRPTLKRLIQPYTYVDHSLIMIL